MQLIVPIELYIKRSSLRLAKSSEGSLHAIIEEGLTPTFWLAQNKRMVFLEY